MKLFIMFGNICLAFSVASGKRLAQFAAAALRQDFIANGTVADHKSWPFIVSISFNATP